MYKQWEMALESELFYILKQTGRSVRIGADGLIVNWPQTLVGPVLLKVWSWCQVPVLILFLLVPFPGIGNNLF